MKDQEFSDSEKLDLHFLNNCPMLTSCPGCGQIVEKLTLNVHLVKECTEKANFI